MSHYFYIVWEYTQTRSTSSTQPWTVEVENDSSDSGDIVGIWERNSSSKGWVSVYHLAHNSDGNTCYYTMGDKIANLWDSPLPMATEKGWVDNFYGTNMNFVVLKKYPKSLLATAFNEDTGNVELTGTLQWKNTWESNYVERGKVSKAISFPRSFGDGDGFGDYYYHRRNWEPANGARSALLNDKTITIQSGSGAMSWYTDMQVYQKNPLTWDEEQHRITSEPSKIVIEQDKFELDATTVTDQSTGLVLTDDDHTIVSFLVSTYNQFEGAFATYPTGKLDENGNEIIGVATQIGVESGDEQNYDPIEIWVRYRHTDEFVLWNTYQKTQIGINQQVELPPDVVGIRLVQDNTHIRSDLRFYIKQQIHPTKTVKERLSQERSSHYAHSVGRAYVYDEDGKEVKKWEAFNRDTANTLTDISCGTFLEKGSNNFQNDPIQKEESLDVFVRLSQNNTIPDSMKSDLDLVKKYSPVQGVFYDLLPYGTTVDRDSISLIATSNGTADQVTDFSVEFKENWENSGQTMMIVRYTAPDSSVKATNNYQVLLGYKLHNTYINIIDTAGLANAMVNAVGWADTHEEGSYTHISRPDSLTRENLAFKDYYRNIEEQYGKGHTLFTQASMPFTAPTFIESEYEKRVKTHLNSMYQKSNDAMVGGDYTYMLTYALGDHSFADSLVLYDLLERGLEGGNASNWHGTLNNVNITTIASRVDANGNGRCAPVVYYSTKSDISESDYDVDNAGVWSSTAPEDLSTVTAVAIDCRKTTTGQNFVLGERSRISAYINMTAPYGDLEYNKELDNKTAYNTSHINGRTGVDEKMSAQVEAVSLNAPANVTLHNYDVAIDKTADPESFDEENPVLLEGLEMAYIITIENKDDTYDATDVIAEDALDKAVTSVESITYESSLGNTGDALSSANYGVAVDKNNKLTFHIGTLQELESVTYTIHVKLSNSYEYTEDLQYIIENTAYLKKVAVVEYDVPTETTYHELPSVTITGSKKWNGKDSDIPEDLTIVLKTVTYDEEGEEVLTEVALQSTDASGANYLEWNKTANPWTYTITNVNKFDEDGNSNVYRIYEEIKDTDRYLAITGQAEVNDQYIADELENTVLFKVDYEVIGDAIYGIPKNPDGSVNPAKFDDQDNLYEYLDTVTVYDDQTTNWQTSNGKSNGIYGKWEFITWATHDADVDEDGTFEITKDTHFKGIWKFTPYTYTVHYNVTGATIGNQVNVIPDDVDGNANPNAFDDENNPYYKYKEVTVYPKQETNWTTSDGTENGIPGEWTFTSWVTGDATVKDGKFNIERNTYFRGYWNFVPTEYTLTYHVVDIGGGLPTATTPEKVTNIPYNTNEQINGVSTTSDTTKEINGVKTPGSWTFIGWYATPEEAEAAYQATANGTTVPKPLEVKNIKKNEDVYGGYIFTPDTYRIDYEVKGDDEWGIPGDSKTPDSITDISYHADQELASSLTTAQNWASKNGSSDKVPGTWSFTPDNGWSEKEDISGSSITEYTLIEDNHKVYGQWSFVPTTYTLTYHVAEDEEWGQPTNSVTPDPVTGINWKDDETLADKLSTTEGTAVRKSDNENVPGVWTFTGWKDDEDLSGEDITEKIDITSNEDVYGKWTFTPNTYTLTYHVAEDEAWGQPTDSELPNPITGIDYLGDETLADQLSTTEGTAVRKSDNENVPGVWTFTGWKDDEDLSGDDVTEKNDIISNEDVYGKWEFTPTTYTLTYHVAEDEEWGQPTNSVTPDPVTGINWKDDETLADKLSTTENTAVRKSDNANVPGVWTFTGWKDDEDLSGENITEKIDITSNEDVYGKWTFTPITYNIEYEVNGDESWGTPEDSKTPDKVTGINYLEDKTLADPLKSEQHWAQKSESDDKIAGTWTFVPDDGWKENADGSGDSVNKIEKIDKDHIVYGRWTFVPAELRMKKVDAKTGEGLSDAKLVLYDETKNEVKKWTSTGEGDLLTNEDGLNIEQVYTIHESNAPVDYKLANDIAFMWKTDGSLKVFTPGVKVENGIIIMADEPVGKTDASITIVKSLVDHEGIPFRVVNESYFVALFSDESRAMDTIASEVVEIPFENASTASVTFENLELGKNYYVGELSMKEDGELITGEYSSLDDGRGIWTPVYGSYKVTPTEKDPAATYEFTNKFSKLPVKSNYFTTLKITKHTTKDGKDYATDKNFYFAVVDDNQERIDLTISMNGAATQDSGDIVFNLASRDEKLSFTVFETVKEGGEEVDNETNKDYQVSYNKKEVTLDIQNLAEEIVVTNEFTSNTNNNNKGSKGNGGGKGGSSPKTGDDTNALGYGLMLILASLIIFVEERRRRKRV